MKNTYDVAIIGAGSGGLTAAVGLAKVGRKVLLIERGQLGGECTNSGCIPSKALLHYAKSYFNTIVIAGQNEGTERYRRDAWSYVQSKITDTLAEETPEHFQRLGIDVLFGEAVLTSKTTLTVNDKTVHFKKAIIATGSSPRIIDTPGLKQSEVLTNQNLFSLESTPLRTLIIGAGPIGMEMGQALAMLGSTVTILDNGPTFAKLEDTALQPIIKKSFTDLGITILQSSTLDHIENNTAYIRQESTSKLTAVSFDKILMAVGRIPNIPSGLLEAGINYTDKGITVNQNHKTSNRRVYALGDVANSLKFTHVADDVARQVVTHIVSYGFISHKNKAVPKVTYTNPEIAQVGLSEGEAENQHGVDSIHRIEVPFSDLDRARTDNDTTGILVVYVKRLSGKILGVHIAGPRAGELLAVFTLAIDNKISLWKLRQTIYAYPTYAGIIKKAGDIFFATQVQTLRHDSWSLIKKTVPKIIIAAIWLSILYYLLQWKIASGQSWNELSLSIFTLITGTMWGPLLYIVIYAFRPLIFFPASALTILAGVFFGLWGFIYTLIGANASAMLAHFIGQFFSIPQNKLPTLVQNVSGPMRTNPFMTILTLHLTFMPFDAVNYAAGIFRTPFLTHSLATFLGTILGSFTFVSIGASLDVEEFMKNGISWSALNPTFILLSISIFVASLGISKVLAGTRRSHVSK